MMGKMTQLTRASKFPSHQEHVLVPVHTRSPFPAHQRSGHEGGVLCTWIQTHQFRHSQRGAVSFLPFICWSAGTKGMASMLLSYPRYLSYLKLPKGVFNPFFLPCALLSKEEEGSGWLLPALALPQRSALHMQCWGSSKHRGEAQCSPGKST